MLKVKQFWNKNKRDLIFIISITLIFGICSILFRGYFGNLFYDCGRELYIPHAILEGKVLYKEIFSLYNPLSYQINALLYAIFGEHANTLYYAGCFNALLIVLCVYFISRQFINKLSSFTLSVFVTFYFIFNSITCTNYLFPYAYAMPYALCSALYSSLFGLLYFKYRKPYWIILSFFMLGCSFANKPEFILCIIPTAFLLFTCKAGIKTIFTSLSAFLLPIILSYGFLFLQGFTYTDLTNYINFIFNFFNTAEQKFYTSRVFPTFNTSSIADAVGDFVTFSLFIFVPIWILKLLKSPKSAIIAIIPALILAKIYYNYLAVMAANSCLGLTWVCIALFVTAIISIKKKNAGLLYLCAFAILSCTRYNMILRTDFAKFAAVLPFVIIWIFFIQQQKIKENLYDKLVPNISLLILGICTIILQYKYKHLIYVPVELKSNSEIIYTIKSHKEPFLKTLNWIKENTEEQDTIIALPEGIIFNYASNRPTNLKYYHLIPNHISALGEYNITEDLSKNLPKYFIINNLDYSSYGAAQMCIDFGFNICNLIREKYLPVQEFESDFLKIKIYRKRIF